MRSLGRLSPGGPCSLTARPLLPSGPQPPLVQHNPQDAGPGPDCGGDVHYGGGPRRGHVSCVCGDIGRWDNPAYRDHGTGLGRAWRDGVLARDPDGWGAPAVMSASLPCCELKRGVKSAWSKVLGWRGNRGRRGAVDFLMRACPASIPLGEESGEDRHHPDGAAGAGGA